MDREERKDSKEILIAVIRKSFRENEKTFGDFLDVPMRFLRNKNIFSQNTTPF